MMPWTPFLASLQPKTPGGASGPRPSCLGAPTVDPYGRRPPYVLLVYPNSQLANENLETRTLDAAILSLVLRTVNKCSLIK